MKAKAHSKTRTTPDITGTIEFIETALHRRRVSDAPLSIDNVANALRRVRRVWDKLDMPVHERRALADVMVRAPCQIWTSPGATSRSNENGRRRSGSRCTCRSERKNASDAHRQTVAARAAGGPADDGCRSPTIRAEFKVMNAFAWVSRSRRHWADSPRRQSPLKFSWE